jgi:hypothetical protein
MRALGVSAGAAVDSAEILLKARLCPLCHLNVVDVRADALSNARRAGRRGALS